MMFTQSYDRDHIMFHADGNWQSRGGVKVREKGVFNFILRFSIHTIYLCSHVRFSNMFFFMMMMRIKAQMHFKINRILCTRRVSIFHFSLCFSFSHIFLDTFFKKIFKINFRAFDKSFYFDEFLRKQRRFLKFNL